MRLRDARGPSRVRCVCWRVASMASLLAKDTYLQDLARKICVRPGPEPPRRQRGNAGSGPGPAAAAVVPTLGWPERPPGDERKSTAMPTAAPSPSAGHRPEAPPGLGGSSAGPGGGDAATLDDSVGGTGETGPLKILSAASEGPEPCGRGEEEGLSRDAEGDAGAGPCEWGLGPEPRGGGQRAQYGLSFL